MPGKLYFAEVDPGEPFNPAVHNREDQDILSLTISQDENQFAIAEVEYKNPGSGLLGVSRKKRVFISEEILGVAVLQFSGRIVGYPNDLSGETIKVTYIAQPDGWETVQKDFFDTLKVAPYYSDLFVSESRRDIEGDILAGYSSLIYWDRIDETIKLSDIIEGSELVNIGENFFYNTLRTQLGDPPLQKIDLNVEAQWQQYGVGEVDVGSAITATFTNSVTSAQINTLTPLAFEDGWKGVRIPTGYTILKNKLTVTADGFGLSNEDLRSGIITVLAADFPTKSGGTGGNREVSVPRVWYIGELILQAVYKQKRRENLIASVSSDIQDIALKKDKSEEMFLRIQDPTAQAQGAVFSGKLASFFTNVNTGELSALGQEVVEHALMRARARLIKTARVVEIQFECPYELARNITTDKSVSIIDNRLPGGSIRGKVTSYILSVDGDSGQSLAKIRLACTIGLGVDCAPSGAPNEHGVGSVSYENEFGAIGNDIDAFTDTGETKTMEQGQSSVDGMEWRNDGTSYYIMDSSQGLIRQYDCPTPYSIIGSSHNVAKRSSVGSSKFGLKASSDGLHWFVADSSAKAIREIHVTISPQPWELSNNSGIFDIFSMGGELNGLPTSLDISPDGTVMIVGSHLGHIAQYILGTPWVPSTAVYDTAFNIGVYLRAIRFDHTGNNLIVLQSGSTVFHQYTLSSTYDIDGAVNSGVTYSVPTLAARTFAISVDGAHLISDNTSNIIRNSIKIASTTMESCFYYNLTSSPIIENPIDVSQMETDDQYLIDDVTVFGDGQNQVNAFLAQNILPPENGAGRPDLVLDGNPTAVTVDLKSMNPEAELQIDIDLTVQPLTLPKQVDLEA